MNDQTITLAPDTLPWEDPAAPANTRFVQTDEDLQVPAEEKVVI